MAANSSPRRIAFGGTGGETFSNQFDATQVMHEASDRYQFNSTQRTRETSQLKHPPRLSPRLTNKSVDPAVRRNNLLTKTAKNS